MLDLELRAETVSATVIECMCVCVCVHVHAIACVCFHIPYVNCFGRCSTCVQNIVFRLICISHVSAARGRRVSVDERMMKTTR